MKCLLVDDEPGIREGLAMLLRRRGFEVGTAADCAEATERLATTNFDVVVTDWRLPDGLASTFVGRATCPVIAVSGHPEEVVRDGGTIALVLPKPIMPTRLLEHMVGLVEGPSGSAPGETDVGAGCPGLALPRDVRAVVEDLLAQLPPDAVVASQDDGAFVRVHCQLPRDHVPMVRPIGGDLRQLFDGAERCLELRLCRDGRPEPDMPVVRIEADWPACRRLALDCDGIEDSVPAFERRLARVQERIRAGDAVCLLNVPARLEEITSVWETTHDMPMRERVGPRLPAELAELWS